MRAKPLFARGALTDWLIGQLTDGLADKGILVGDAVAPKAGGWTGSQPGQGNFVSYVVLSTGAAQPASRMPLAEPDADDWAASYTLRAVGAMRQQCDWTADQARLIWGQLPVLVLPLGPSSWKVYQGQVTAMGEVRRNDATDPPYWEVSDTLGVNLARSRAG